MTLLCFFAAGGVYYALATRMYESSAKLLIVEQQLDRLSAMGEYDSTDNTITTHRELVVSPVVIEDAISRLEPRDRIDLQGVPAGKWIETISRNLSARVTRKTNIIDVSYRSVRPESALAVVRAVIDSYLAFVEKNHKGTAGDLIAVLTDERDRNQAALLAKQRELQEFRKQVGHLAVSQDDRIVEPLIQRAVHLNDVLLEAKEKRLDLQTTLASVETALSKGEDIQQHLLSIQQDLGRQVLLSSLGLSPEDLKLQADERRRLIEAQQALQDLSVDYGPNHPRILELQQQIKDIQQFLSSYHSGADQRFNSIGDSIPGQTVVKLLQQALAQAQEREDQLNQAFEQAQAEAVQHSNALVGLEMLEREVQRDEDICNSISEKIATIDISQIQAPIKATVVREPVADDTPVTPRLRLVVLACLLGGTLVGGVIIYVQDILDDRFNSPEEMAEQLGAPVLAMVRKLTPLPGVGMDTIHINAMPYGVETEAFRTLRTALSVGTDVCDRILITSSEPGDGKTTISANLAVAFAQAGKRTLLIDADLRRPGFTSLLNLKGQPGVADVISSGQPVEEAAPPLIHRTEVEGLDVLPVGFRRPNPAELLSSKQLADLLAWADAQYDRLIVDCPPILAVSDAQIVGQLVDGAILVVRPDKNHRRSVIRAVDSFQSTGCRIVGIVANGLSKEGSQYGYGYGYGYGYSYGYGEEYGHEDYELDEDQQELPAPIIAPPSQPISASQSDEARDLPPIRPRRAA